MIRECGFCDQTLEGDEKLHPVFIGSVPKPEAVVAKSFVPKSKKSESVGFGTENGGVEVLGKPVDEVNAVLEALEESDEITLRTFDRVHEPQVQDNPEKDFTNFETRTVEKVSAEIIAKPKLESQKPDMRVCKHCKEKLQE